MTRIPGALAVLLSTCGLTAAGILPPIPRIPAEALKPIAKPAEPDAPAEDEAAIADRIAKNTKAAADRLKDQDTGDDTRKTQNQTLKDIDALLKKAENPPPMGGGSGDMNDMNKDMDKQGGGGGGQSQPMGGGQSQSEGGRSGQKGGGGQQAGGGKQQSKGGWQERRQQERGSAQKTGEQEKQQAGGKDQRPAPDPNTRDTKQANAGGPGGNDTARASGTSTSLPLDEMTRKQVWGHLPEKLRQQMSQYYKEQFMPKYGDLLRQYYSSLAEREKAKKK